MAKLFIGLAIVVMLGAAVLGFLAKGNIDKLQSNLKETRQTLDQTKRKLQATETELKKSQEDLATANTTIEKQIMDIAGLKKDKEDLATKVTTVEMERDKVAMEFAAYKVANPEGAPPKKPDEVDPRIAVLQAELATAKTAAEEAKVMQDNMKRSKDTAEEKLSEAAKEIERYRQGVTKQGLTGKVLAVNPGWNFVVLSVGDRQGAATGGMMIVTRGGEPIGRVRITSIEPSTSIADIVPGSIRRGVTVQPGDAVIYEGPRAKPAPTAPVPAVPGGNLAIPNPTPP